MDTFTCVVAPVSFSDGTRTVNTWYEPAGTSLGCTVTCALAAPANPIVSNNANNMMILFLIRTRPTFPLGDLLATIPSIGCCRSPVMTRKSHIQVTLCDGFM